MDRLEQYLDQVCRSIGGPVEMRQHVRQELREHLLDALAQHRSAGLSEEAALAKALEEFGKPEEMRSDLEAAHGQRMTWILDKAMQWKEKTMKAKWLWMTLAHVSVVLVIALAVMWISFADIFLLPKFEKLLHDGIIDPAFIDGDVSWMPAFLNGVREAFAHSTTWLLLLAIAAVALFEWRVKSENKPWIRLSVLGTAAVGLTVLGVLMAGSLVICFCLGVPAMSRMTRPFAVEQVASIDKSVSVLEEALAKKDWKAMREPATEASNALSRLANGPAVISLTRWSAPPTVDDLRGNLKAAQEDFRAAEQAICDQDAGRLETELQKFRKSFEPLRVAAKRPGR